MNILIGNLSLRFTVCILFCIIASTLSSQISSIRAEYDDDFGKWTIYRYASEQIDEEEISEEEIGELKIQRRAGRSIQEWQIYYDGTYGTIAPKWVNDPSIWEIQMGEDIFTIRQLWRNDITQWKITDNQHSYKLQTSFSNNMEEWSIKTETGDFFIYTEFEFDIRDWLMEDNLEDKISENFKIAISCFSIIQTLLAY